MNSCREFSSNYYSPNHTKESNINYILINGHYINGFIAGDGCLGLDMGKHFAYMCLSISQHKNNKLNLIYYLQICNLYKQYIM